MSKKGALAVASAILGIVLATTTAIALNLGILDRTADNTASAAPTEPTSGADVAAQPGEPTSTPTPQETGFRLFPEGTEIITVYIDEPTTVPAVAPPPAAQPPAQAPAPAPQAPQAPKPKRARKPAPAATQPPAPTHTPAAPTPTATATPMPAANATPTPTGPTTTYPVYDIGSAGQVALAFNGSSITFWGAYPNAGWEYAVEDEGPRKVKVEFRRADGEGDELEFQAELDGNEIKTEVGD